MSPPPIDARGAHADLLQVRRWVFDDIAAIRRITLEAWLDAYRGFIPEEDLRDYFGRHFSVEALERAMASSDVHGFMGEHAGRALAWMRTHRDPGTGRCSMTSLYVLPDSQRRGAGARLLEVAERCARSHRSGELWLGVMEQNRPALEWYLRHGFAVRGTEPFTMGKTTVTLCLCAKQLENKGTANGR